MGKCGRGKGDGRARPRCFTLDLEIDLGEALEVGWIADGHRTLAVQCRFECGDARYAWLDGALAVGEAQVDVDHVDYRLFAVSTSGADRPS